MSLGLGSGPRETFGGVAGTWVCLWEVGVENESRASLCGRISSTQRLRPGRLKTGWAWGDVHWGRGQDERGAEARAGGGAVTGGGPEAQRVCHSLNAAQPLGGRNQLRKSNASWWGPCPALAGKMAPWAWVI